MLSQKTLLINMFADPVFDFVGNGIPWRSRLPYWRTEVLQVCPAGGSLQQPPKDSGFVKQYLISTKHRYFEKFNWDYF